jgi:hypothetical protein
MPSAAVSGVPTVRSGSRRKPDARQYTILTQFTATGASALTARQDSLPTVGRPASLSLAWTDLCRVEALITRFDAAAAATDLPPALLAAIASRETRCGNIRDADGFGDAGHAFGIMQVDRRSHPDLEGLPDPRSQAHTDQAAGILNDAFALARHKSPDQPLARQLQAAIAAYNCGIGAVASPDAADGRTTGRDYSNDVWTRAQFFFEQWPAAAGDPPSLGE